MSGSEILNMIRRRRDEMRERSNWRSAPHMIDDGELHWCIAEEYDRLIAQIEAAAASASGDAAYPLARRAG